MKVINQEFEVQNKINHQEHIQDVKQEEHQEHNFQNSKVISEREKRYLSKQGVDINFQNLSYKIMLKKKNKDTQKFYNEEKTILNNINGICKQGQVTAIMGASGAGKTSLLNILAKRVTPTKTVKLEGDLKANNLAYSYEQFPDFASYVMQDDRLLESLTVREVLQFAARLKIKGTQEDQDAVIDRVVKQLKLERSLETLIGGKHLKGVSGGERKRVSIAFEIISDPQVLLLDEPTSGLDSFTAFLVINSLKKLAVEENKTIIFTIHQPSSDIWNMFDRVLLLVKGNFIYQGKGGNAVTEYFNSIGFKCPIHSNPADYVMSIMHSESEENVKNYPLYYQKYSENLKGKVQKAIENKKTNQVMVQEKVSTFSQEAKQIITRNFKQIKRNPILFKSKIAQSIFMAVFTGCIYWQLENGEDDPLNQRDKNNFAGFFYFICVDTFMQAMMSVVLTFPDERAVFLKEENAKFYSISSYFFGSTILDIPFLLIVPLFVSVITFFMVGMTNTFEVFIKFYLTHVTVSLTGNSLGLFCGSAFSDPKQASAMTNLLIMPLMLFSGFIVNRENLWDGVSWLEYLSPFKYGFDAMIHNEFEETYFRPSPIEDFSLDIGYWYSIMILIIMFFCHRIFAFCCLYYFKKKLQ